MYRTAALVVLSLTVVSVSAHAADETASSAATATASVENMTPSPEPVDWSLRPIAIGAGRRPSVLPVLYVSFAALQAFDAYSTTAVDRARRHAVKQRLVSIGFFERVHVLPLKVLDDLHFACAAVVKRFHLHRDAGQASESRGTEAACSYDQLEVLS